MTEVLIGTAGHIDHGKTTLVRALTGIDTDRLKEEKARGITIDIGFAHCELAGFRVGFIDVPGHERFVKNMLAGVGGIQLVMLAVAADESVMPQTREHFEICRLLGIRRGLIALTKRASVDAELLPLVTEEVRELVAGSFLAGADIVAVDSVTGEGLPQLRESLSRLLDEMSAAGELDKATDHVFRMPIDRVFSIRGFGTVVTGTPSGGRLGRDTPVKAYPSGRRGKVRGIEIFGEASAQADAGQRTALNLSGLERADLSRGMVLSPEPDLRPSHMFDVTVQLIEGIAPLEHRAPIRLHHGSAEAVGRIYLLGAESIEAGSRGPAQLRLDQPLLAFPGERFILRRYSPMTTIGGGLILDNDPPKYRRRDLETALSGLRGLAAAFEDGAPWPAVVESLVLRRGAMGMTLQRLTAATGLPAERLARLVGESDTLCRNALDANLVLHDSAMVAARRNVVAFLERFHDANPLAAGASREEVHKRLFRGTPAAFYQTLLAEAERDGLVEVRSGTLALKGRRPQLSEAEEAIRRAILEEMARRPLAPPTLEELERSLDEPSEQVRNVYYFLLQGGELVRITGSYVVLPDQLDALANRVARRFPDGRPFTVAEFKQVFDLSRKYAIPLLEHLDRNRVTRRQGDQRVVL